MASVVAEEVITDRITGKVKVNTPITIRDHSQQSVLYPSRLGPTFNGGI